LDGEVLLNVKNKPATMRGVIVDALLGTYQSEPNLSGEDKLKRFELAVRLKAEDNPVDLSIEELQLAKQLIGKGYAPLISGQVWQMLEGKDSGFE